jgi:hypothetical protein
MYAYYYLPMPNGIGNNKATGYDMDYNPECFKEQSPTGFFHC